MNANRGYSIAHAEEQIAQILRIGAILDTPTMDQLSRQIARTKLMNIFMNPANDTVAIEAGRIYQRVFAIVPKVDKPDDAVA
jgi:hypothetical protein